MVEEYCKYEKSREHYKNLSQEEKDKIKEYQKKKNKNWFSIKKKNWKINNFLNSFFLNIKMSEKTLKIYEVILNKKECHRSKEPIDLLSVNIWSNSCVW